MKATVKIYENDGGAGGLYPVKLILTHQKKIKRSTIGHSSLDDWDMDNQLPKKSHDDFEYLYGKILNFRAIAETGAFKDLTDLAAAKEFFLEKPVIEKDPIFYDFAQKEIEKMIQLNRTGNAKAYDFSVNEFQKFAPFVRFSEINGFLLERYKQHKLIAGLKFTSIRTYLYELRAIYNRAVRLGVTVDKQPFKGLFLDLPVQKRRLKNEYLDKNGIKVLKTIKGVSKAQQMAVDFSLLQFYLGGMDLCDIYFLKKSNYINGRIYTRRKKLGSKAYQFDVLVVPPAKKIIEKYMDPGPGEYLFKVRIGETAYATFRATHNKKLQRIQANAGLELKPTGGRLTSKVIRHSFATIAKFKHIPVDVIRELMAHERVDIDTVYKDIYPETIRDEALKKIVL